MITVDQIKLLSDKDILTDLCSIKEDELLYAEFVARFLPEVTNECSRICELRKLDRHVGKQIAHEVFENLRKYKSFKQDKVNASSTHNGILVYLYKISRNLFNDWHNQQKKNSENYVCKSYFDDLIGSLAIPDTPDILKWKKEVSTIIFKKLNNKEQKVVLADIDNKRSGRYLPDDILENLALLLGVKKATVRKIRERAIIKIKKAIDEINQQ